MKAAASIYYSRRALRVADANPASEDENRLAILPGTDFRNGAFEIELAGDVAPGSMGRRASFTGVAFRFSADVRRFECFYLRPSNVEGAKARLYGHGAEQPVLIVNDLKMGATAAGPIALWVGPGTVAHFANLRVTPR